MTDNFETYIIKVAKAVADKAEKSEDLPEATEALKVLTQYYALRLKHQPEPDDPEDESFGGISAKLADIDRQELQNGGPKVRNRRGRTDA